LTGSKNALKGIGFFLGGLLLTLVGFRASVLLLATLVLTALLVILTCMHGELGRADGTARFSQMFSNSRAVNVLSAARLFLFASRDVWFVVGLPVFRRPSSAGASGEAGAFLAACDWLRSCSNRGAQAPRAGLSAGRAQRDLARRRACGAAGCHGHRAASRHDPTFVVVVGLAAFGMIFALNSAVHSYLILSYAESRRAAMNVGFYYMANAGGRLTGTVLSGALYQWRGFTACLWASVAFVTATALLSLLLPRAEARFSNTRNVPV
jgi:predicted MFS family arabinose efflux permease